MVFTNSGRTTIRNFLAGLTSGIAPTSMLWGTASDTASVDATTMSTSIGASFTSVSTDVTRQVQYEGILLADEATGSVIRQIGISTETTGTSGTLYLIEDIAPITKTNLFDMQTFIIVESR